MGTLQGLGSPHATGDAGTLMSSHSRYGQNINQDYLKEWWKTGWWERRARQQGRWEENWAEQVPSKGKLIPSKQTEDGAILSCMVFQQKSGCIFKCGLLTVEDPEYRPLSTPRLLLPATEKNWMALFPSLWYHFLSTKEVKRQEIQQETEERQEGDETTENSRGHPPSLKDRKERENTRCLGVIKLY